MATKPDRFKFDNIKFDMADAAWSSTTVTYTDHSGVSPYPSNPSHPSHWSVPICPTCKGSPCLCNAVSTQPAGVVTIGTIEDPIEVLLARLSICQVCGAEDAFVLCSVCVEAVKLARNRWLDEFRREIEALTD